MGNAIANEDKIKIVLDAGHGGRDPGAVGWLDGTQHLEKDYALDITLKAADKLAAQGHFWSEVTHEGEIDPAMEVSLEHRVDFSDRHGAELFVSIHCNAMPAGHPAHGFEVFHFPNSMSGNRAAVDVFEAIAQRIGEIAPRSVKPARFFVLRHTAAPAILVECGFMSDRKDLEMLAQESFREKYAEAIVQGICNYFDIKR